MRGAGATATGIAPEPPRGHLRAAMSAVDTLLEMVSGDHQPSAESLPKPKSAPSLPRSSGDAVDKLAMMIVPNRSVGPVPIKKVRGRQGPKKYRRKQGTKRKLRREDEEVEEEPEEEDEGSSVDEEEEAEKERALEKVEKRQEEEEEEPKKEPLVRAWTRKLPPPPPLVPAGPTPPRNPPPLSAIKDTPSPGREAWMAADYVLQQDRLREEQEHEGEEIAEMERIADAQLKGELEWEAKAQAASFNDDQNTWRWSASQGYHQDSGKGRCFNNEKWRPRENKPTGRYGNSGGKRNWWYCARAQAEQEGWLDWFNQNVTMPPKDNSHITGPYYSSWR